MKRILINLKLCLTLSVLLAAVGTNWGQSRQDFDVARARMVREVIVGSGISDKRVIDAMLATPRHEFVSRQYRKHAYFDMALPIGHQQTISSPGITQPMSLNRHLLFPFCDSCDSRCENFLTTVSRRDFPHLASQVSLLSQRAEVVTQMAALSANLAEAVGQASREARHD